MNNNKLDLAPIKKQVSQVVKSASSLKINSSPDMIKATDVLGKIKSVGKEIKEKRDSIIKPINEAKNNAMDLFRPLENEWLEAERIVKSKMVVFSNKQQKIAQEKADKIAKEIEDGKIDMEKGAEKMEKTVVANKVEAENGSVQFRIDRKVIIEDETLIPREFLIPDMVKIRRVALSGIKIAGVKVVEEKNVSGYTK